MFTLSLQALLAKKGIRIERKMPKEVFIEKQNNIIELYKNAGFQSVPREIILFMCYFNSVKIAHKGYEIEFNLEHTLQFFTCNEMIYKNKLFGKSLIPLGTMQSGWYDVFADETAAVYAFHIEEDELVLYGSNPFEALENILKNNPLEQCYQPV